MTRGVALGGFMGVGKSTVGRALAVRLGWPFVDLDDALAARHGPVAEQLRCEGERVFRAREAALVSELCDGASRVLATGGGAWVAHENRERLRTSYHLVVLTAPLEVLRRRVASDGDRPLWDDAVAARYERRRPAYADADLVVETTVGPGSAVEEILRWLASR